MDFRPQESFPPAEDPFTQAEKKRKYILITDDNEGDRVLLRRALEENQVHEEVRFVNGGLDLLDLLEQCKSPLLGPSRAFPCLILLDLYMPRLDGHETLRILKNDPGLKKIPVIILTSSHTLTDVVRSYHDGANSFLTKPLEYDRLVELIALVKHYWLQEAQLPV